MLTAEERERRLREMQENAEVISQIREKRLEHLTQADARDQAQREQDPERSMNGSSEFLDDLKAQVFLQSTDDVASRLAQRRNFRQRGDIEQHTFLE